MLTQPQPPARPDIYHWRYGVSADRAQQIECASPQEKQFLYDATEEDRCAYDKALVDYLHSLRNERWLMLLVDMSVYYRAYTYEGTPDPNWKRGGPN